MSIKAFLAPDWPGKVSWLSTGFAEFYLRKGQRYIGGVRLHTVDLANVVVKPEYRRHGHFKAVLADVILEAINHEYEAVYVENVLNEHLVEYFDREGVWNRVDFGPASPPSYYMILR